MIIIILILTYIIPIFFVFLLNRLDLFIMSLVPVFNWYIVYYLIFKKNKK